MEDSNFTDPSATATTVLLVSNLHCPSCVTNIQQTLARLGPEIHHVSSSTIHQTVTIQHAPSLPSQRMVEALDEEGFDMENVSQKLGRGVWRDLDCVTSRGVKCPSTDALPSPTETGNARRLAHMARCGQCRSEQAAKIPADGQEESAEDEVPVVVDRGAIKHQLVLSIQGMTCASCISRVNSTLREHDRVENADVNLLNGSAIITVLGDDSFQSIADAVEDIGYEATIVSTGPLESPVTQQKESEKMSRAVYAIEGMSCSSCVASITAAIQSLPGIDSVHVNLISASTLVVLRGGKDIAENIRETIETIGFGATLQTLTEIQSQKPRAVDRTVALQVQGMYCRHCPGKVHQAIDSLGADIKITKPLSYPAGYMEISYRPQSPTLTIRTILESIASVDPAFAPRIHHPPSLEERARRVQSKHRRNLAIRLALAFITAIPTFIIGIVYMTLVSRENRTRQYLMEPMWTNHVPRAQWALFILATPVYFLAADQFHRGALKDLYILWRPSSKTPLGQRFYRFGSMDLLLSLGTTAAYFGSIAEIAVSASLEPDDSVHEASYFDAVVLLTMFLLAGRLLEAWSKRKAGNAVSLLGQLRPREALLLPNDDKAGADCARKVPVDQLENGDVVIVPQGSSPPADGIIVSGDTQFQVSSLTGESKPASTSKGDEVFTGTINLANPVTVRVTGAGGGSLLDHIIEVVREGQARRAPIEKIADVLTAYFVPFVTYTVAVVWIVWLTLGYSGALPDTYLDVEVGSWAFWALRFAIAALVVACPCGIGLAAPTAIAVGTGLAAKHGVLAKGGGEAFQAASNLDCIVFDKTGTITEGKKPTITAHESFVGAIDQTVVLGALRSLEGHSSHPLGAAAIHFCNEHGAGESVADSVEEIAGKGMKGRFQHGSAGEPTFDMIVGNEALLRDHGTAVSDTSRARLDEWKHTGASVILVAIKPDPQPTWELSLIMAASDPIRPEAPAVIAALQQLGLDTWMISGDNPTTASAVAAQVGIPASNVCAGVLPHQKADKIHQLQRTLPRTSRRRGLSAARRLFGAAPPPAPRARLAMVGDGINDAPALALADVGVAMGSGADAALASAGFVLVASRLRALLVLLRLSRAVMARVRANFAWALAYNMVALPVAAGVLYPVVSNGTHVRLDPVWASLAMALSSVSVVTSSLLLRTGLPGVGFRA